MSNNLSASIKKIVSKYENDRYRLMDIVREAQDDLGHVGEDVIKEIADALGIHRVEVRDMVSFYHLLSREPRGKSVIRLCNATVEKLHGMEEVARAFEKAVGVKFGETSPDGTITLEYTPCIGMSDQAPSALVNGTVVTALKPSDVPKLVDAVREGKYDSFKGAYSSQPGARVENNIRKTGPVIFSPMEHGDAIRAAINGSPEDVTAEINKSRLRGRGGAGFPTAMKWDFCRKAEGKKHYLICNADEGEPGTFKDRVILTEAPDLLFEGMAVAGYAIGAELGLLYLRAEYQYLYGYLQDILHRRRRLGLLGENICGKEGFNFDIRIQLGAGAYVCGEESSLIESLEGKRGAPRDRPPFPVTSGYMLQPTSVNNVETLCCAARIMEKGADWFAGLGTKDSTGTKIFSVSGDCRHPGVYEVEYGITIDELLDMVGAENTQAVQVGGPSGTCVARKDFGRRLCYEELATGGSIMIFNRERDLLAIVRDFIDFFVSESCGWCAPCRVGTTLLQKMLDKLIEGRACKHDLDEMEKLAGTVKMTSRCGLGQTAANPILTTLQNIPEIYKARIKTEDYIPLIEIDKAVAAAESITGRESVLKGEAL
jgi:[NiFe] hydrogenase diaphorase moiety large subunit